MVRKTALFEGLGRLGLHLGIGAFFSFLFLVPGYLYNLVGNTEILWFSPKYFATFFAFGLILSFCRNRKLVGGALLLLGLLEFSQFASLAYFGQYITPYSIRLMFVEGADVMEAAFSSMASLWYLPLVVGIPYGTMALLLKKTEGARLRPRFVSLLLILFLLFPAIRIQTGRDIFRFFPVPTTPTLMNTLNSYYVWLTVLVPRSFRKTSTAFKPYKLTRKADREAENTVVVIMGESLTSNRMHLFGYKRETTPRLDALAMEDGFLFRPGIAGAIATRASLPIFYNIQYNPENRRPLERQEANLFHLAKKAGYGTTYISAQKINCLNGVDTGSIDYLVAMDTAAGHFETFRDEGLLELARTRPYGKRNFVVLHQRSSHAPYEAGYAKRPAVALFPTDVADYREGQGNAYDNSVRYNDAVIADIIEWYKENVNGPLYVFATSDHGEEFGEEEGRWGHMNLSLNTARVPFLLYARDADPAFMADVGAHHTVSHYEMAKMVADRLGWKVENPNEKEEISYVNGLAAFGESGMLKLVRRNTQPPESVERVK